MFLLSVTVGWHVSQCKQRNWNEWHAQVDGRGFGIKHDLIPLFALM